MKRFKNILVVDHGADEWSPSLARAQSLAVSNGARLTLVHVLDALPRDLQILASAVPIDDLIEMAVEEHKERLERHAERIRGAGVVVEVRVLRGTPFIDIIREVLREGRDLVMMMAEGTPGLGALLFGGTSMHLMRKCPCPVWVVKPGIHAPYARVMAAVDPLAVDQAHDSLNVKILELASSLAWSERSALHVVHAWLSVSDRIGGLGSRLTQDQIQRIAADTEDAHRTAFDALMRRFDWEGLNVEFHAVKGNAGDVIPQMAAAAQVDVLVLGTVCRSGLAGFFIGNTAERVLRQVDCSVLTVKPEGFITPVTLD